MVTVVYGFQINDILYFILFCYIIYIMTNDSSEPKDIDHTLLYPELIATQFVDQLPTMRSFEHFLYDNRARRIAVHTSDQPILFNEETVKTQIPNELSDILGTNGSISITDLHIIHIEEPEYADTTLTFKANGESHTVRTQYNQGYAEYIRPNNDRELTSYRLGLSVPTQLLASLLYMREYQRIGDQEFDLDESALECGRIGDSDIVERIIMTLGHFDGVSSTTTECFVPVSDQIIVAMLTTTESPELTHSSNDIELSLLEESDGIKFDAIGLSQQLGNIKKFTGEDFNDQYSEVKEKGRVRVVTPEKRKEWIRLCKQFKNAIEQPLRSYAYLDEATLTSIPIATEE